MGSAQRLEASGQSPRQAQRKPGAAPGPRLRTRQIRSQWELSQSLQSLTPIGELLRSGGCLQPCSLPLDDMAVLDRKLRQPGGLVLCSSTIERIEFVPEHPLRPTVRYQMMK